MYKLTYFDIAGRGEAARLIMAAAGVKYVDNRVKFQDWPALKKTLEWEQLPILQVGDDKTLTQSTAIYRYLARKFKLTGADEWEAAKCDELVDAFGDLAEEYIAILFKEQDPQKKEARMKNLMTNLVPTFINRINKIQMENGGQWLIGKNMTWADIVIAEGLRQLSAGDPNLVNRYPHVRKMMDAVFAQEGIKKHVNARKI